MEMTARLAAATCLLVFLSNASALDRKTYGANACKPSNSASADLMAHAGPIFYNSTNNVSTAYIECPIVRDNTLNTNGTRYVELRAQGSSSMSCTLQHTGPTGSITGDTASLGAGFTSTIGTIQLDVNVSEIVGTYALRCTLPPASYIWGYVVDEH